MLKEMGEDESGEDYYEDDINEVDEFWKKKNHCMDRVVMLAVT